MEFILVLVIFSVAILLLSLGRLLGSKHDLHGCKGGEGDQGCATCSSPEMDFYKSNDDPGFKNVAQLGNPNRKNRFIDKLDFKPERFK